MSFNSIFGKNFKTILQIVLLIISVMAYVLPSYLLNETGERIAQKVEHKLQEDERTINDIAINLQEILLINGKEAFQKMALEYQKTYSARFAFFLYESDTLSLWTDNHIPLPLQFSDIEDQGLMKFGTYQVVPHYRKFYQFNLVSLQIVKLDYPWQNAFLQNHLAAYLDINTSIILTKEKGISVVNLKGEELFQIQLGTQNALRTGGYLFFLFVLTFFFLSNLISTFTSKWALVSEFFKTLVFFMVLLIWYFIHYSLKIPEQVMSSDLFSHELYASGWIYNNLGNLFFLSLILFLGIVYYVQNQKERNYPVGLIYLFVATLFTFLYAIIYLLHSLVFDSQIFLDLYQLASLNLYSYLALWIIFILQLAWILLTFRWTRHFLHKKEAEKHLWIALILIGLVSFFFDDVFSFRFWVVHIMGSIGVLLVFYLQAKNQQRRLVELLTYLIFFTFITALVLNDLNRQKERLHRETSAMNLGMENDPYFESHFLSLHNEIIEDTVLLVLVLNNKTEYFDDSLYNYISSTYFKEYLEIYNINLIHCDERSEITILPDNMEVACYQYFSDRIEVSKSKIEKDVLYLVDGGFQYRHYIGLIKISQDSISESCIFIEFVSKIKQQDLGLPSILEKSHAFSSPLTKNYSYAFYKEGVLNDWKGKYDYKQKLSDYHLITYHDSFFEKDNFQHYIYSKSPGNVLVISLEDPGILQKLASFAFVFLFYSLLTFLLYTFFRTSSLQNSFSNFQGRLQYSMIILLLFSFVLIGISSLYYIIYLNQQKNADNLMEKAHSVLIELEHKLSGMEEFNEKDKVYVESLLAKFSEVFFTDITLFTREGNLLASSRPQVFQSELLSQNMNANAYYQLSFLKNSFFIQNEQIGTQEYLSAYLPFRNQDNQSVAYLNLPYFAKQYELEDEVSGFIVAFLNIYLFLLFIAIMITIFISRYLSRPLLLVKEKISKLNLQKDNEKIDWNKNDEIGDLVKEYNRMVEELEESAHKLAISQRESAWREMAQQIAHEIKNPLTPMKLNVQYLEKAWDDQVEDYEERMKRITKALKEQIDALSEIAGQFSTFAAIEKITPQTLELKSIIENVIAVFKVNEHIHFEVKLPHEDCRVLVDKNHIIRVFNNIYKNAVQALSQESHPKITTSCIVENGILRINIQDNGIGIPQKELAYIFEPKFTTKTGGMGLGLALVKKMLENANASIEVISEESKGTTFSILIPMVKN